MSKKILCNIKMNIIINECKIIKRFFVFRQFDVKIIHGFVDDPVVVRDTKGGKTHHFN